ncbi:MAG: M20/M25/M40 family metallo-hydrolase [Bacteroidetes bacterium]|nr:M20/M25/M40 family metallo-hydrolase [Bacteroidota bacterium]
MRTLPLAGLLLALSLLLPINTATGQAVLPYARSIIDTLSAPGMHGRGYVNGGHAIAAQYIAAEFKQLGLASFGNGYFQEFSIAVNTFPKNVALKLGKQQLEPGSDFLVAPCSQNLSGRFSLLPLPQAAVKDPQQLLSLLETARGKVLLVDKTDYADASKEEKQRLEEVLAFLRNFKNNPAAATLVLTDEKLTWHVAQQPCERPELVVDKKVMPDNLREIILEIESHFIPDLITQNVVGVLPGKNPGSGLLVFSAHYDHLGRMGQKVYFPGANDNASGIAMLLSLAKHFSQPANQPEQDILFVAFGAEEAGLLGSSYFVQNPLVPLENISFMINLDITGTGDDGIKVVNGSIFTEQFTALQELNKEHKLLKQVAARGEACNSDHCPFYERGVPSFFIYTLGGIQAYHDVFDKSETLPLTEFEDLHRLLVDFTKKLALIY